MAEPAADAPRGTGDVPDSIEQLAADLRKLRLGAHDPTLNRLRSETDISRSVLSDAFAGRKLPSARTVSRIVRACGGDVDSWVERRDALAGQGVKPPDSGSPPVTTAQATVSRRAAIVLAAGAFVLGVLACAATAAFVLQGLVPAPQASSPSVARTGQDPASTPCVEDAAVAASEMRGSDALLEIIWSDNCQAGWGRITRYDGLGGGNTVSIAIYPEPAASGPDRQEATEHDVQSAYTSLVVRPTADTLLCAEGSLTVDGKRIDLGDPLCT